MKSVDEIYEELKHNYKKLSKTKFKSPKKIDFQKLILILLIAFVVLSYGFLLFISTIKLSETGVVLLGLFISLLPISWIVLAVYCSYYATHHKASYREISKSKDLYRKVAIETIIKEIDPGLEYRPEDSQSMFYYSKSYFGVQHGMPHSAGAIVGKLENHKEFYISNIIMEAIISYTNSDSSKNIFDGLYSVTPIPIDVEHLVVLTPDEEAPIVKNQAGKLDMDSGEFEKYFEVKTGNKLGGMQLLTADVMSMLVEFRKKMDMPIDISFEKGNMHIRYHSKLLLLSGDFDKTIGKDEIEKTINVISSIVDLNKNLNRLLENK